MFRGYRKATPSCNGLRGRGRLCPPCARSAMLSGSKTRPSKEDYVIKWRKFIQGWIDGC